MEIDNSNTLQEIEGAYAFVHVPIWARIFYALLIFYIVGGISFVNLAEKYEKGRLLPIGWLWIVVFFVSIYFSVKFFQIKTRKELSTENVPVNRLRKVGYIIFAIIIYATIQATLYMIQAESPKVFVSGSILLLLLFAIAAFKLLTWKYDKVLTRKALEEQGRLKVLPLNDRQKAGWEVALDNALSFIVKKWWLRYLAGALLIYIGVICFSMDKPNSGVMMWGAIFLAYGMYCVREVIWWVLGILLVCAVVYIGFGLIALLPVSVAIIIGALIIANSNQSK